MAGFVAELQEIQSHAAKLEAFRQRFGAIKSASLSISSDEAAYGVLCGWMAGILGRRQQRQGQLLTYVEDNLSLAATALMRTSREYADVDDSAAGRIRRAGQL
jgi:hypothetical protein